MSTQLSPAGEAGTVRPDAPRAGRHARPIAYTADTFRELRRDRSAERIKAADRALREAYSRLRSAGGDSDAASTAFAIARDTLSEAYDIVREARRELILVHHEHAELSRRLAGQGRYPVAADPVVSDAPGVSLCPDPGTAETAAEFMNALRTYRVWAGVSRAMESVIKNQCSQHFASSTLHAALTGDDLPTLPLVQAVVSACGGTGAHHQMFTSAWRRLTMPQHNDVA